jgi:hypothetical protein
MSKYICIAIHEDPPYNIVLETTDVEPEEWLEKNSITFSFFEFESNFKNGAEE